MKEYLILIGAHAVTDGSYYMHAYRCKTNDPYHTIGEIFWRTMPNYNSVAFIDCTPTNIEYLKKQDIGIYEWKNKYEKKSWKKVLTNDIKWLYY